MTSVCAEGHQDMDKVLMNAHSLKACKSKKDFKAQKGQ